jgi:hypothetical protein
MANVSINWEGLDELKFALNNSSPYLTDIFEMSLAEESAVIFARSQMLVPVATGVLKGSGYVTPIQRQGTITYQDIGYGGPAAGYAMWVHESFSEHKEPTQRKYLERPVNERSRYLQKNIAIRMNDMLQKLWMGNK